MVSFFIILHVRGRNRCICRGEMCFFLLGGKGMMCFILLGGVLTSFFLYNGFVTMFTYIVQKVTDALFSLKKATMSLRLRIL